MSRIINNPIPWKYTDNVFPLSDDDIFVDWANLSKDVYEEMLVRWLRENPQDEKEHRGTKTESGNERSGVSDG
jgi:hypothetical protein